MCSSDLTDFGILGDKFWGEKTLSDEVEVEIEVHLPAPQSL